MASAPTDHAPRGSQAKDDGKNEMIAKAAGVIIAAGIGLTLLKAGRKKRVGSDVSLPEVDGSELKGRAEESASAVEHKSKGFFNRAERKLSHTGEKAEDAAKQGQRDAKANADRAGEELKRAGHQAQESAERAAKKTGNFFNRKSHEAVDSAKSAVPSLKTHTVRQGDTLWGLSRQYGVNVDDIRKDNFLASSTLVPGQTLAIRVRK